MKAPDAFRTISEVAEDLDLPQHVLRFWETRFNQIKPMKRGGGRRYYRPEDVDLLRGIRLLLYAEGFTIRGVQRLLKEKGLGYVAGVGQTGSVEGIIADRDDGDPEPVPSAWEEDADSAGDVLPEPGFAAAPEPDFAEPEPGERPKLDLRTDPGFAPPPGVAAETAEEFSADLAPARGAEPKPGPQPASTPPAPPAGLSHSDRRRIEFALADLLEAKRLLDTMR